MYTKLYLNVFGVPIVGHCQLCGPKPRVDDEAYDQLTNSMSKDPLTCSITCTYTYIILWCPFCGTLSTV